MTLCFPFLMFQGQAQEALDHYLETFPDAQLLEVQHHPEGTEIFDPAAESTEEEDEGFPEDRPDNAANRAQRSGIASGSAGGRTSDRLVATAQIRIGGQVLMIQDSLIRHGFSFTPSVSLAVVVDSSVEFDGIVEKLGEGGDFLMTPGDYDFAKNFAWIKDRFGVSWQVNHPLDAPDGDIAQAKAPEWS